VEHLGRAVYGGIYEPTLVDCEPMMAVNLGTQSTAEALDLLEYCNHPGGTYWSDLRVNNGSPQPHGIRMWCLGSEMYGPWQLGHRSAADYGMLAAQTAAAMRRYHPTLELVACIFATLWSNTANGEEKPVVKPRQQPTQHSRDRPAP
jgi:alpha-L-arabinofuranosidase